MIRLTPAIVAVMTSTLVSGVAGGIVGAAVGRFAPSIVAWIHSPGFGNQPRTSTRPSSASASRPSPACSSAGTGLFLVVVISLRDAWLTRAGIKAPPSEHELHVFD